jgi:hypothetical protein
MSQEIIPALSYDELKAHISSQLADRAIPGVTNLGEALYMGSVGADLGLSPSQSLRAMYLVKGKPILSAQAIQAVVVRNRSICKYFRLVESTHEKCTYETLRDGDPEPTRLTWTIQMAQRAGLLSNGTWKAHPEAMLRARAVASLARAVYPDLILGVYEEDEGREIAGDYRAMVQEPVASLPARAPQLPAAAPDPIETFAPLPNEPSELDSTLIGQMAAALAEINACSTLEKLNACALRLKGNPLAAEGTESRKTLLEAHTKRRTAILVKDIIDRAAKPEADHAALWQEAQKLNGVSEQQEVELAAACGIS